MRFVYQLLYKYTIYFPATLYDQVKNGVLVGSLEVDLKETLGGEDSVSFQTSIDGNVIKYRYITKNISFRYNITMELSSNKEIYIFYKRTINQKTLNHWNTRRMTGFSFDWHIENDQQQEIRIEAEKKAEKERLDNIERQHEISLFTDVLAQQKKEMRGIIIIEETMAEKQRTQRQNQTTQTFKM